MRLRSQVESILAYADRTVLMTIPGMTLDLANRIMLRRQSGREVSGDSEAWLVAENALSLDQFRHLAPYITCRGDVYTGISIGGLADQPQSLRSVVPDRRVKSITIHPST